MFDRDNLSAPEAFSFTTVRIVANLKNGASVGTGFFYNFQSENGKVTPAIITNKHVVDGANTLDFVFHVRPYPAPNTRMGWESRPFRMDLEVFEIINHEDDEVDLCAILTGPLDHSMRSEGIELLYTCARPDHIVNETAIRDLQGMDPVVMVGYPSGLWDSYNNMPVIRKGVTATHPILDYGGKKEFLIDIACFPGSSGSPIFWYESGTVYKRSEDTAVQGWRLHLLGILYAGPQYTSEGEIKIIEIPTNN